MWLACFIFEDKDIEDLEAFANYVIANGYEMTHYAPVLYKDDDRIEYTAVFQIIGTALPLIPFNPP